MAGQLDHAGALIARVLALDPTFVWGWERSGWVNAHLGEPDKAIRHLTEAIRLDPRPPSAANGRLCAGFSTELDPRFELSETCFEPPLLALEQADAIGEL
jgi:predicted TPR repeat methyltransferase